MTMIKVRKLTVTYSVRFRRWDTVCFPEIRLTGKWLEEMGFKEGQKIEVSHVDDQIIIKHLKQDDPDQKIIGVRKSKQLLQ